MSDIDSGIEAPIGASPDGGLASAEPAPLVPRGAGILYIPPAAPQGAEADKLQAAAAIYTSWRNTALRGLATPVFNHIEAASGDLIRAIAAAL